MTHQTTLPWNEPGWLDTVGAWVDERLDYQGISRTGELEPIHERPWAAIVRIPTTAGTVYFKAVLPRLAHEIALTEALARWRPEDVLPVIASDTARHWMLLPDGGTLLRGVIRADKQIGHWQQLLPHYARLQIACARRVPDMLKRGVPDRRLASLPAHLDRLLQDRAALHVGHEHGLSDAEIADLQARRAQVAELCRELAAFALPESIHHGDLHDGNIFIQTAKPPRYRLFDWGDASVSHPFFSLRTAYVSTETSLGLDEGAPELDLMRDAYLQPWTAYAAPEELRRAFAISQPLASLCSALSWDYAITSLPEALRAEYAVPVPALLREMRDIVPS